MKGPSPLLSEKRKSLYQQMVRKPLSFSEADLALYVQHSRLDPRLAEVVTEHIRDYWWKYDSLSLNKKLKVQPWPEAIKPMIYQISEYCESDEGTRSAFLIWGSEVVAGIRNARPQLYFIFSGWPRSKSEDREVTEALEAFKKAGYFAKDLLFNKGIPGAIKNYPLHPSSVLNHSSLLKISLLKTLRPLLSNYTLEEIKNAIDLDRTTASKIRSGKVDSISADRLSRIASVATEKLN